MDIRQIKLSNFIEKDKIIGVHCPTKELASELLNYLHFRGYKWAGGQSLIKELFWNYYKTDTCYFINTKYKNIKFLIKPKITGNTDIPIFKGKEILQKINTIY